MPNALQDLFPKPRSVGRVGVVDIGSNSVRLVVFDGNARNPDYFFNEKIMCELGAGLSKTGRLNPEGRARALRELARFQALADMLGTGPLIAVATAAVRDASDGPEFCREVKHQTGLDIIVLSGPQEAELAAYGVLMGRPASSGCVVDIGGASMEIAQLDNGALTASQTSPLGPLKLIDMIEAERPEHIRKHIKSLYKITTKTPQPMILVGGSWRAIARIDMHRRDYPLHVLHEYDLSLEAVQQTRALVADQDPEELRRICGISAARMALLPLALQVLEALITRFEPTRLSISAFGLREGVLFTQLRPKLRDADPLLKTCARAEELHARQPGFGDQLARFVAPLFEGRDLQIQRLIHAAALIHDIAWRTHPDFRADACFDFVTRANMAKLSHQERIFLAVALSYRYRNKTLDLAPYTALISPQWAEDAQILGRALRFGAMFLLRSDSSGIPAQLEWSAQNMTLTLHLDAAAQPLYGEIAEKRFEALAKSLQAQAVVQAP